MYEVGRNRSGLRRGYTTGTCAAAAAKAAAEMLLSGEEVRYVRILVPAGMELFLDVEEIVRTKEWAECAVRKYSGDDPDVTDGLLIFARVTKKSCIGSEEKYELDADEGVGRVTRRGLEQKPGMPAINKVPRKMIKQEIETVCKAHSYEGGIRVVIRVPGGEEIARKTFNPRLGIIGGISILGTTGIVEPMSEKALTDTIYLELKMQKENGHLFCCVVPGNYGMDFLTEKAGIDPAQCVKCSNYVGEVLDDAVFLGMEGILLAGHIGKFIKLAAGVMNTHSRQADCRMEILGVHAAMSGADSDIVRKIMRCMNTTEALEILEAEKIVEKVMKSVMNRIGFYIRQRTGKKLRTEYIMFSSETAAIWMSEGAEELLKLISRDDSARKE